MLHGEEESKKCSEQANKIFSNSLSDEGLPVFKINRKEIKNKNISDIVLITKIESSKSEIKRLIKNNGIKINNLKIESDIPISKINLVNKNFFKLSIGKKKHFKILIN